MNDESLPRLLDAAAKASCEAVGAPPLGLETRVLAQWRAAREDDAPAFLFVFLRRAMIAACFVFILSAAWSFTRPGIGLSGEEAVQLDYQIQMSLNP